MAGRTQTCALMCSAGSGPDTIPSAACLARHQCSMLLFEQVIRQQVAGDTALFAGPTGVDAAGFAAVYQPLLGLWAVGASRAAVQRLPHVAAELAALADALCRRGRLHPLLGDTLVTLLGLGRLRCRGGPSRNGIAAALRCARLQRV